MNAPEEFAMYGMNKKELRLMPHDAAWKDDFAAVSNAVETAARDAVIAVEHVGSTAIPSVFAKPVLDIAILCNKDKLETLADALRALGYDYRGRFDDENGHFYAVLDKENVRYVQAHIYTEANADWYAKLNFRDILRKDSALAKEYNDYKLSLAETVSDKSEYAAIKTKWVDTFILKVFMNNIPRVKVTDEAKKVIARLREKNGKLMFHQSGGCCDGSSPMCYADGEFLVGSSDIWLGEIDGCDFYMAKDQFEFWKHTELTIDVTPGRGASFSLEIPLGVRFVTKSRVFTYEESQNLTETRLGDMI